MPRPRPVCIAANTTGNWDAWRRKHCLRLVRLVFTAKRSRREMAEQETEALGKRVAELYRELSYPGAAKFQAALRKRGIKFSDAAVRELVAEQGGRQLFAPPSRFVGRVTARHVDERWASDVMDFQAKENKSGEVYILCIQGIFSRFLWARALTSKTQVGTAFLRLMEDTSRTPKEVNTDGASEFTSQAFQRMLYFNTSTET